MATTTPNLGLLKPVVGADADAWGGQLNASLDTLDAKVLDKTTGGTVSGNLSVTGTVNTPNVNAATALNLQTGGTTKATLDSAGNLGLGVTPSAWGSTYKAIDVLDKGSFASEGNGNVAMAFNAYYSASEVPRYKATGAAFNFRATGAGFQFLTAPSGTTGATINFGDPKMTLTQGGNLLVGTTTDNGERIRTQSSVGGIAFSAGDGATSDIVFRPARFGSGIFDISTGAGTNQAISFSTANGAASIERARITSVGDFLVGTTTSRARMTVEANSQLTAVPYDSNDTRADTASSASFFFRRQGTIVGNISTTTTATSFNTSSDYRLKNNQQPLTGSGDFIDSLMPKTWEWTADGSKGVGFIAHEVQAVSPGSVTGEKDAVDEEGNPVYQVMEYGSAEFIANIVAELQSLRKRLAALEAK